MDVFSRLEVLHVPGLRTCITVSGSPSASASTGAAAPQTVSTPAAKRSASSASRSASLASGPA